MHTCHSDSLSVYNWPYHINKLMHKSHHRDTRLRLVCRLTYKLDSNTDVSYQAVEYT